MKPSQDIASALLDPAAYPWSPASVTRIDTHLSRVFLAGERVVKIKRPVDLGFVDFRTLEARRRSCEDEIRLNRDLTRDVYLEVLPITSDGRGVTVGGVGPALEWATVMRRLPAERMLDELILRHAAPPNLAQMLADVLIPFHRGREATCDGDPNELERASTAVVTENLDQTRQFAGRILEQELFDWVSGAMERFVASGHGLLIDRAASGWIREGHGDLRAEHVCVEFPDRVQVFDCVEFSKAIRCADVASDLAFLIMDLRRLGELAAAEQLLDLYRAAGFELPDDLVRFYVAHRALVRAKVAGLTLTRSDLDSQLSLTSEAADHLDTAVSAVSATIPVIIAVGGLSGTGKSTVARRLSRCLNVDILTSDLIRKELAGVQGAAGAEWGRGIYSREWTDRTYAALATRANELLTAGRPVILDASYLDPDRRDALAQTAAAQRVPLTFVEATCEPSVVERRLIERARAGKDPSDASVEIYRAQTVNWSGVAQPPIPGANYLSVDTTDDAPARIGHVIRSLADSGLVRFRI